MTRYVRSRLVYVVRAVQSQSHYSRQATYSPGREIEDLYKSSAFEDSLVLQSNRRAGIRM